MRRTNGALSSEESERVREAVRYSAWVNNQPLRRTSTQKDDFFWFPYTWSPIPMRPWAERLPIPTRPLRFRRHAR